MSKGKWVKARYACLLTGKQVMTWGIWEKIAGKADRLVCTVAHEADADQILAGATMLRNYLRTRCCYGSVN